MTKDTIDESNTWYAQGGIAAVLQPLDSFKSHVHDTEIGGAGLCDESAVKIVIEEGPQRVLELLKWGANFDKKVGNAYDLDFTMEGGHSFARIIHAYGDATGKELAQTLIRSVRSRENIRIGEHVFVIDLLTDENRCLGVIALVEGKVQIIWAKRTILASGGAGQALSRDDQPKNCDRRRARDGLPGRCPAPGHGDGPVPPDDFVRGREQSGADYRGRPRRGGVPGRPTRVPVHERLPPARGTGPPRRGQPGRSSSRFARRITRTCIWTSATCRPTNFANGSRGWRTWSTISTSTCPKT